MLTLMGGHLCVSAILVDHVLSALAPDTPLPAGGPGFPHHAAESLANNVIVLAVHDGVAPSRAWLLGLAATRRRDVVLVRHGGEEAETGGIAVDLAVRICAGPLLIPDTRFFRRRDGALWLVPTRPDLFVHLGRDGIDLSLLPPWDGWDEHTAAIARAAAEIDHALRSVSLEVR